MSINCPVCLSPGGAAATEMAASFDGRYIDCSFCGYFGISRTANVTYFRDDLQTSPNVRATLSWMIKNHVSRDTFMVTMDVVHKIENGEIRRPNRSVQIRNFVRWMGDEIERSGETLGRMPHNLSAIIGAISPSIAKGIVQECIDLGIVRRQVRTGGSLAQADYDLGAQGWEIFESTYNISASGNYGFIALKFNEPELDSFIERVVKPATLSIGYGISDMRDFSQAGLIDNLMRNRIRESAFVIAELSHDNLGAYWEAGFAEGIGKPVIYMCNKEKFLDFQTHFDVNHYTTLLWSNNGDEAFMLQYVATVKRSLGLT